MFQAGEYVVYGLNGVCYVEGIIHLDIPDIPKNREYYSLVPIDQGGKIYVNVDTAQDKMRNVISKTEAEDLISGLKNIEPLKISNDKTAEEMYKNCIRCNNCREWVKLIKCIYQRKQKRLEEGKKITARDEKYMRMAEEALYSELGIALGIRKDQVPDYIMTNVS